MWGILSVHVHLRCATCQVHPDPTIQSGTGGRTYE